MQPVQPTPNPFNIPDAIVRKWLELPQGRPLTLTITRTDIDSLFQSIDGAIRSTSQVHQALIDYTNGRLEEANAASANASIQLMAASNQLRIFMNAVMAGASLAE